MVPLVDYIGEKFVLMNDNAMLHTVKVVQGYIKEVGFRVMEWVVRARLRTPTSISKLIVAVQEEIVAQYPTRNNPELD